MDRPRGREPRGTVPPAGPRAHARFLAIHPRQVKRRLPRGGHESVAENAVPPSWSDAETTGIAPSPTTPRNVARTTAVPFRPRLTVIETPSLRYRRWRFR